MTQAFDDRLVRLTVAVEGGDTVTYDENFYIFAAGTKYTDGSLGECGIRIDNIAKTARDYLVTKTSPWAVPRTYANITLDVGRRSLGRFNLFAGQATASNPTQPPNIGLIFTSLTQSFLLGNIGALNAGPLTPLKTIAQQVADQLQLPLDYRATANPQISNYSFSGPVLKQVQELNNLANINAFIDNNTLVVIDTGSPRNASPVLVNSDTGMVGVPEVTELGARVRMLITNEIRVGDSVTVQSKINPAANGTYFIYKLGFEIASRDTPFYWVMELRYLPFSLGFQ